MIKKQKKVFKLKEGDLVRIDPPMLGEIKKVSRYGYVVKVFASQDSEVSYYGDSEVYKVSRNSEWAKASLPKAGKKLLKNK